MFGARRPQHHVSLSPPGSALNLQPLTLASPARACAARPHCVPVLPRARRDSTRQACRPRLAAALPSFANGGPRRKAAARAGCPQLAARGEDAACRPSLRFSIALPSRAGGMPSLPCRAAALCAAADLLLSRVTSTPRAVRALQPPFLAALAEGRAERPHCVPLPARRRRDSDRAGLRCSRRLRLVPSALCRRPPQPRARQSAGPAPECKLVPRRVRRPSHGPETVVVRVSRLAAGPRSGRAVRVRVRRARAGGGNVRAISSPPRRHRARRSAGTVPSESAAPRVLKNKIWIGRF